MDKALPRPPLVPSKLVKLESNPAGYVAIARSEDAAQAALKDHYEWMRQRPIDILPSL